MWRCCCYSCDKNCFQFERLAFILCNNYYEQLEKRKSNSNTHKNLNVNRKKNYGTEKMKRKHQYTKKITILGFIAFSKFKFVCKIMANGIKVFCVENPD